jgi:hypothetical protein
MPAASFRADVWMTSLEALLSLKERWKVSVKAMIMRCDQLDMIPEDQVKRLWISYNRRWKTIEPKDDLIPFESPQMMKRCFDMLIEANIKSREQILHELPYSQRDIETLMNLPEGYFNDDFGRVRYLPSLKQSALSTEERAARGANVIDFEPKKSV